MVGIIFSVVSAAFLELATSIGKKEIQEHVVSRYSIVVMHLLGSALLLSLWGLYASDFTFMLASLPTFLPRLGLEIVLAHVSTHALVLADRGDFALVKTLTLPVLLGVDIILGYALSFLQLLGVGCIMAGMLFLLYERGKKIRGLKLLLVSSLIAVATISLYKYDITHFNSVAAEQGLTQGILVLYFLVLARVRYREHPLALLRRSIFQIQTLSGSVAHAASAFAYVFAPAAVITSALRASHVVCAFLAGTLYFHEKGTRVKLISLIIVIVGLILLAH